MDSQKPIPELMPLSANDIYLFNEGSHFRLYRHLGAHWGHYQGKEGVLFSVWAPNAQRVSVCGDFNRWQSDESLLHTVGGSGIWQGFVANLSPGEKYKFRIVSHVGHQVLEKADPFAFYAEVAPKTASIVWSHEYEWHDDEWMQSRKERSHHRSPISIYELHLGSWRRGENNRVLNYHEIAPLLVEHVKALGFTHVEFLPVMEHPFYGSWGYQVTGYFAPTSRYGTPQDLMFLIDALHQANIGVILDWVPSHFPTDGHGLAYFDGTALFEHQDHKQGYHPDWRSAIFNYGRHEVRSFLISSALFWLDVFHVDGLRVDGVASMLYLDYSRREGEWIPNRYGGRENLEAVDFLKRLNETVYLHYPEVQTYAEESTAWPGVTRPTHSGGLGFGYKWDMGFMHDTLKYFSQDPIYRHYRHNELTFRGLYAFTENYVLAFSHDEVVHLKRSLLDKMPGDAWQKFANLRLLFAYMFAQPGKKLLFMGGEFGQWNEWNHEHSLDWHLCDEFSHQNLQRWLADLNHMYVTTKAMHQGDCDAHGFSWIDAQDSHNSILSFLRRDEDNDEVIVVFNFTPVPRFNYQVGVSRLGFYREILNSDAEIYGGSSLGNLGGVNAQPIPKHSQPYSLSLTLPPLAAVFLRSINDGS